MWLLHLPAAPERAESCPSHPSDWRQTEHRWKITVKVVFGMYVHLVFSLPVVLRPQAALTVILLGFNNGRAGRMPYSRTRGGLRRSAGAASCSGFVPRAAAARCGGFPTGASHPS